MSNRAPVAPDELDYFPTPPWAARAGGELIGRLDAASALTCWEPACGEGHMAYGLADYFGRVVASDVFPYGFGPTFDFLGADAAPCGGWPVADWIVTNPPFAYLADFARAAMRRARRGVAMLCRLQLLESVDRHELIYGRRPMAVDAPFAERVPMVKGRWDPSASSASAYGWFVWMTPAAIATSPLGPAITAAQRAGGRLGLSIPPGTRARLTKPEDAPIWGSTAPSTDWPKAALPQWLDDAA